MLLTWSLVITLLFKVPPANFECGKSGSKPTYKLLNLIEPVYFSILKSAAFSVFQSKLHCKMGSPSVWLCVWYLCVQMYVHVGVRDWWRVSCSITPHIILFLLLLLIIIFIIINNNIITDRVFHWTWSSLFQLDWLVTEIWGSTWPHTPQV